MKTVRKTKQIKRDKETDFNKFRNFTLTNKIQQAKNKTHE